jgi:hypothetical protein
MGTLLTPSINLDPLAAHKAEDETITGAWKYDKNIDLKKNELLNAATHSGAILPTDPAKGFYLHEPIGRKILYHYDGSSFNSLFGFGLMEVYVDETDGKDDLNKGFNVNSDAFKTIQFAIDSIPVNSFGNVIINLNNESYSESVIIQGKKIAGDCCIDIVGTMIDQIGIRNVTGATYNTVTVDGPALTVNAHVGQLIKIVAGTGSDNLQEAIILSNTASVIAIVGSWAYSESFIETRTFGAGSIPDISSDIVIEDFGTTVNNINILSGQKNVRVRNIKLVNPIDEAKGAIHVDSNSRVELYGCYIDIGITPGRMLWCDGNSRLDIISSFWDATTINRLAEIRNLSVCYHYNSWGKKRLAMSSGVSGWFWASRISGIPANFNGLEISRNSIVILGFNANSGVVLTGASGTGYDLLVKEGSGASNATNINNTITTKNIDATKFGWET